MKALTIKQPWVHAILREGKDIENRSWQRRFRGWLAIHASAQPRRGAEYPRGVLIPDGKDYFTIYDFVKAHLHFSDPEWDGEPIEPEPCPKCGERPCVCEVKPRQLC